MRRRLLIIIPVVVVGLIAGSAVIGMKSSAPAAVTPQDLARANSIAGISTFSAVAQSSSGTYQVKFSLVDRNNTAQSSDFNAELRFVDLENNTLFGEFLTGKASDFGISQMADSTHAVNDYTIPVDASTVHTDLATSPEVISAQAYLDRIVQQHGSQSVEAGQANQMLQQTKQLAAESLTAIIEIQLPNGKTFTASTPVIG